MSIEWSTKAEAYIRAASMVAGVSRSEAVEAMLDHLSRKTPDPKYGTAASFDAHAHAGQSDAYRVARRKQMDMRLQFEERLAS